MSTTELPKPTGQDAVFASQARSLMGTVRLAAEEAEQYIAMVKCPALRAKLEREWENV
jgi:hypothetical protein